MSTNPTSSTKNPRRGEIWIVNLNPTKGSELRKTRPAVVISSDAIRALPVRLVAPITGWKSYFAGHAWHVQLRPTSQNGLRKDSAVDAMQIRGLDVQRFDRRLGHVSTANMEMITIAVAAVIEYE